MEPACPNDEEERSVRTLIGEGLRTLGKLSSLLDEKSHRPPKFKMILTAVGDCAYTRKDGFIICPLSALKP